MLYFYLSHCQLDVRLEGEGVPVWLLVHQVQQVDPVQVFPLVNGFKKHLGSHQVLVEFQEGRLAGADIALDGNRKWSLVLVVVHGKGDLLGLIRILFISTRFETIADRVRSPFTGRAIRTWSGKIPPTGCQRQLK